MTEATIYTGLSIARSSQRASLIRTALRHNHFRIELSTELRFELLQADEESRRPGRAGAETNWQAYESQAIALAGDAGEGTEIG